MNDPLGLRRKPLFSDPFKRVRQIAVIVVLFASICFLCHVISQTVIPLYGRMRTESWISALEKDPTERNRKRVAWLIDNFLLTKTQANRAIPALVAPVFISRDAYPWDGPAMVFVEKSCMYDFEHGEFAQCSFDFPSLWKSWDRRILDGESLHIPFEESNYMGYFRYQLPEPATASLTFSAVFDFKFEATEESRWCAAVEVKPKDTVYKCTMSLPLTINFVSPQLVPPINLVSDPVLDASMSNCFRYLPPNDRRDKDSPGDYIPLRTGAFFPNCLLQYEDLPVPVAFKIVGRMGGHTKWQRFSLTHQFTALPGTQGAINIFLAIENLGRRSGLPPGNYDAEILLVSDPTLAYQEPSITEIWDGTLTFPIKFRVD